MSLLQTKMNVALQEDLPNAVLVEKPLAVLMEGFPEEPEATQEKPVQAEGYVDEDEPLREDLALGEDTAVDCAAKVARLSSIDGQDLAGYVGHDPWFPPSATSIAEPGVFCGDSAQGISESCEKFNHWKTFEAVSKQLTKTYSIIGPSGITFDDIQQGALGNCYFLAALASIANINPALIENMFVDKHLWNSNIFKTKWLVNGKESTIAVDNMIPAGSWDTYFTHGSPTGEWWPVVLSKTWAKIVGSFKGAEGGQPVNVATAITQAPAKYLLLGKPGAGEADIWAMMMDCMTNKYPMYAGTGNNPAYGLVGGHAFAVLGAYLHDTYGKVVKVYNPHGKDHYKGSVPNTVEMNGPKPGVFTLKLSEFMVAFEDFSYNPIGAGYKATALSGLLEGQAAFDLSVNSAGKFWVSPTWPSARMIKGCGDSTATVDLKGQLTTEPGKPLGTRLPAFSGWGYVAYEFPGTTAGTYALIEKLKFGNAYLKTHTISVYAPGTVTIAKSTKSVERVTLEMYAPMDGKSQPCTTITSGSGTFYLDETKIVNGAPTYWTSDGDQYAYLWPSSGKWLVHSKKGYEEQKYKGGWSYKSYAKSDWTCGTPPPTPCADAPGGVPGFNPPIPCSKATDYNYKYSNVKCTGAQYSARVQKACKASCGVCPGATPICADASGGVPGFGVSIPCSKATDTNYMYNNVKCTGAQYSNLVQGACKKSCGLCG
jgi:hypothetical protein